MPRDRRLRSLPLVSAASTIILLGAGGCPTSENTAGPRVVVIKPLPVRSAVDFINGNNAKLQGTIQARNGHARGHFVDRDGRKRDYDLDAAMLVYPPRCMRMDLAMLGKSQLLFGSNDVKYWLVQPGSRSLSWGRHDQHDKPKAGDVLIRPDLLVEAVGFNMLPTETTGANGPAPRIAARHQELIYFDYDDAGQSYVSKEYWLSRTEPRVLERIVFRDSAGAVAMDSKLSEYRQVERTQALAPHRIQIEWPATGSTMLFTVAGWRLMPEVGKEAPSFMFPLDRNEKFSQIVDVDTELENSLPQLPDFGAPAANDDDRASPPVEDNGSS